MSRIGKLVVHNLKKEKGQYISFGLILCVTALIINMAFVLVRQMDMAYDDKAERLETADIQFLIPALQDNAALETEATSQNVNSNKSGDSLEDKILQIEGVSFVEKREGIMESTIVKDFRGTDFDMNLIFYNMDERHVLNQLEVTEQTQEKDKSNEIYLPLYISEFGEFDMAEEIVMETGGKEYTFFIAGTVEEMQFGNYGGGMMGCYLPKETYEKFAGEKEDKLVSSYSLRLKSQAEEEAVMEEVRQVLQDESITTLYIQNAQSNKKIRTMVCTLVMVILLAFALIVLLVSLFLCKFRIQNRIEREMANLGVLKALGYTGSQIIWSVILPYLLTGVITSLLGIFGSYMVLPGVSEMLALQSGLRFRAHFDVLSLLLVVGILFLFISVFTYVSAGKIRKLQPILAIRGMQDGGKSGKGYYVLLFLVMFVMTILISFAGVLMYNVVIKPEYFMKTLSEESPSVILQVDEKEKNTVKEELQQHQQVRKALFYANETVEVEGNTITAFVCEDFSKVENNLCYEGRNPQQADEIAVGNSLMEKEEMSIGDQIVVKREDTAITYTIVGFVQSVNYQGEICELTKDGMEQLQENPQTASLYVYLEEGADVEAFVREVEEAYPQEIYKTVNYDKMTETSQEMYAGVIKIVIAAIFAVTICIILLILFIIMKSYLVQNRQELGIYKAIGYSNKQLMLKLAGSFLPVSFLAVLLSALLGKGYMPVILNEVFQMVGAMKNECQVPLGILMLFGGALCLVTFFISVCLTLPIKKISAYSLIRE